MMFRLLVVLACIATVGAVTKAVCQEFCASVNGASSYEYCSPWLSFSTQANLTCYNKCVSNCYSVYDGSCMTDSDFRCCLDTLPTKKNEFQTTGCNILYNDLIDEYWN